MPDENQIIEPLREQAARNEEAGFPHPVVHLASAEAAVREGFAAGRAAATPDGPKGNPDYRLREQLDAVDEALGPWQSAPGSETGVVGRVQTIRNLRAALLLVAVPDERLREAVAALPQYVITIQDREGYTYERGCAGQPMNYTGVMLADVEAAVDALAAALPDPPRDCTCGEFCSGCGGRRAVAPDEGWSPGIDDPEPPALGDIDTGEGWYQT